MNSTHYAVPDAIIENPDGTPYQRIFKTLDDALKYVSTRNGGEIISVNYTPVNKMPPVDDKREMRKAKMAAKNK
jgi:hypothetical protein